MYHLHDLPEPRKGDTKSVRILRLSFHCFSLTPVIVVFIHWYLVKIIHVNKFKQSL